MIRKKRIIRIKRRNPEAEISEEGWEKIDRSKKQHRKRALLLKIDDAFVYASPKMISNLRVYLNQGFRCDDCDKSYRDCKCEYCEDCEFEKCLCALDLHINEWDSKTYEQLIKDKTKIRKIVWEFAKLVLSENELNSLLNNLRRYTYNDPHRHKNRFVKELTINSSFPKEHEIMIRLFDLD